MSNHPLKANEYNCRSLTPETYHYYTEEYSARMYDLYLTDEYISDRHNGRLRVTPMGEMPTLSGMVFSAVCGAKLYQVRGRNLPQSEYMVCAIYL